MKTLPLASLLFGLGLAGGFWSNHSPGNPDASASHEATSSLRPQRNRSANTLSGLPADVAARLAAVHAAPNATERLRAIIQLASEIPVSEMHLWYDRDGFGLRDAAELNVFYDITSRRWLEVDPEGLIDRLATKNSETLPRVAAYWAKQDPDRVLSFLDTQRDPAKLQSLREALLPGLTQSRPDEVMEIIRRSEQPEYRWYHILSQLVSEHPEKLAATISDFPSNLRQSAEQILAAAGLSKNFSAELDRLLTLPNGHELWSGALRISHHTNPLGESILQNLDRLPADWIESIANNPWAVMRSHAEQWLEVDFDAFGITPSTADQLKGSALSQISFIEPEKTLAHLSNVDFTSNAYQNSFTQAVVALARKDRAAANSWLDRIPEGQEQLRNNILTQIDSGESQMGPGNATSSKDILSSLQESQEKSQHGSQLYNQLSRASPSTLREVHDEIRKLPQSEQAAIAGILQQNNFPRNLPNHFAGDLILAATQERPTITDPSTQTLASNQTLHSASDFAVRTVLDDPSFTTRWVQKLPEGEVRQWTLRNMASNWIGYDAPATNAWIATLPSSEQADIRQYLENSR